MRRTFVAVVAAPLMLAGCATDGGARPEAPVQRTEAKRITYETAPCFGTCPVYRVTIRPHGEAVFEGLQHTAVAGSRAFTVSPETYRRFAAKLEPYRPDGERLLQAGSPGCENAPSDMPGIDVRWSQEPQGATRHLSFYKGCRADNEALATALEEAPRLLPIGEFIGSPR